MTKTQKIIVMVAAVLIFLAVVYPPYNRIRKTTRGDTVNTQIIYLAWGFAFSKTFQPKSGLSEYSDGSLGNRNDYSKIRFDILSLEIFGILVLAGAAYLITKKR
jgi:hypothetical protein